MSGTTEAFACVRIDALLQGRPVVPGELARKTQVLFFTHHRHLVDIARRSLGDSLTVISLNT